MILMKRYRILVTLCILILIAVIIFLLRLFDLQYNLVTGISSSMNIKLDEQQEKIKLGKVKKYTIYVEGINPDESYFMTIFSNKMSLKQAVKKKKLSIRDMERKYNSRREDKGKTILEFEDYEVVLDKNNCLIRPLSKE